jgi:beta-lactamase superfamily II metal-dependent hydrolase
MHIDVFQSDKGDCLLLEGSDGKRILCDGGEPIAMADVVADELGKLRSARKAIDLVYISHIDQDHIGGIVTLLEYELEWRSYEYHRDNGETGYKKPASARPPEIRRIWHNSFRDQVTKNRGAIEDLLAAHAPVLLGTGVPGLMRAGLECQEIALSIPQAMKVSQYASDKALRIPVNTLFNGGAAPAKLLMRRKGQPTQRLGSLHVTIVAPSESDIAGLRKGWDNWLKSEPGKAGLVKTKQEIARRLDSLSNGVTNASVFDLRDWNGVPDYDNVTAPNIASLVLLVEEGDKKVLLTGDSHPDMILAGLADTGITSAGYVHLDVLKVQHHGSEHNMNEEYGRTVSADTYIFCGNGSNTNPEISVIEDFYESRMGAPKKRARAPKAKDRPFRFVFSTNADYQEKAAQKKHMASVEKRVQALKASSGGKFSYVFNDKSFQRITV